MHTKTDLILTALLLTVLLPFGVLGAGEGPNLAATKALFEAGMPFEQDIVVTAYYSPTPDQCCYVKGGFAADVILNGEGTHGADGTRVYPGMVAAPPSYPFGTRIVMPGIGTVTVHDRGGAIQEWTTAHRIDLWAGVGEEGLARALQFGVQHIHATVYPPSSEKPAESIDLAALPAPPEKLRPYLADSTTLLDVHAKLNDKTVSVELLQERLKALGYFQDATSGMYGPVTQKGLRAFYADMGLHEPDDHLTENGAAHLQAAFDRKNAKDPIAAVVDAGSSSARISEAQRTLRFLGFYNGRTDGKYSDALKKGVLAFQQAKSIVDSAESPGVGRIGLVTRKAIVLAWRQKLTGMGAERIIAERKLDQMLVQRGYMIAQYLGKGDHGDDVRMLQKFLASKGYMKTAEINGSFGARTQEALIAYQQASGIIRGTYDVGAGYAGPATLAHYRRDLRQSLLKIVRAKGWAAI
jgi:peptidoglycan hydrolase-like protein with peptidoglycan-binding domain/3D (Asp-Asp-Asp) domain-containing protein